MRRTVLLIGCFALPLIVPAAAGAHAFGATSDLPMPSWLFIWGAGVVLVLSFFLLALAWRRPKLEHERWIPLTSRVGGRRLTRRRRAAALLSISLFALIVGTAFWGSDEAGRNFALTFVFVTFWVGFPILSALFGDFFKVFSPWLTLGRAIDVATSRKGKAEARPILPAWVGRWPAAIGLVAFGWLELVLSPAAVGGVIAPATLGAIIVAYTLITLALSAVFGAGVWTGRAETFSAYLGMFGRISPIQVREGIVGWRGPLRGLVGWSEVPGSSALVLAAIGITTFDGAGEGILAKPMRSTDELLNGLGISNGLCDVLVPTLFLLLTIGFVAGVFDLGMTGIRRAGRLGSGGDASAAFAHCLVPIALGYLVAHYFSYLFLQIQAQFTYLLVDPFGLGWNLLGLGRAEVDFGLSSEVVWAVQVTALLAGHLAALVLAHDRALALFGDPVRAMRTQYWMLATTVFFTSLGLFLLSYSNQ